MTQKLLNFQYKESYKKSDFIISLPNVNAYKAIEHNYSWPYNRLLIIGEKSSGKTHLAKIWQDKTNAVLINKYSDLKNVDLHSALILENIENQSENTILEVINLANEHSIPLLMTASIYPEIKINDLRSRINSTHKYFIKKPDLELLKVLLVKQFSDRQIKIQKDVTEYIVSNMKKSFSTLNDIVELIDKFSQIQKKKITKPLAKRVLEILDNFEDDIETRTVS